MLRSSVFFDFPGGIKEGDAKHRANAVQGLDLSALWRTTQPAAASPVASPVASAAEPFLREGPDEAAPTEAAADAEEEEEEEVKAAAAAEEGEARVDKPEEVTASEPQPAEVQPEAEAVPTPAASRPAETLQDRWLAHQRWAREAFALIAAAASTGFDGEAPGLGPMAIRGPVCAVKLEECLQGSIEDEAARAAAVDPLVKFLSQKAAADSEGKLQYDEFEAFTWKIKQMEHNIEAKAEFVFKMFGGNKIGNLTRVEFMELFKQGQGGPDAAGLQSIAGAAEQLEPNFLKLEADEEVALLQHSGGEGGLADEPLAVPVWGAWAAPSDASDATPRSTSSAGAAPPPFGARTAARQTAAALDAAPISLAHLGPLADAPAAWRELVRKKGLIHRDWARSRFASLDTSGDGHLTRANISGEAFAVVLLECLGDRLPEPEDVTVLIDAAMRGADVQGDGRLRKDDFEAFTWRLKRMVADVDFEMSQALGHAAYSAWRDLVARAKILHDDWAATAFSALDVGGTGALTREDLQRPGFEYLLRQCPGGRLADVASVRPCFGLALRRAGATSDGRLGRAAFQDFTWRLARMGVDVEVEARRFADMVRAELGEAQ